MCDNHACVLEVESGEMHVHVHVQVQVCIGWLVLISVLLHRLPELVVELKQRVRSSGDNSPSPYHHPLQSSMVIESITEVGRGQRGGV